MSYSSTNPARVVSEFGSLTHGNKIFAYESSHDSTDIAAAAFFASCGVGGPGSIGMSTGDVLMNINTGTNGISWHRVTSISTSTGWESPRNVTVGAGSTGPTAGST